MSLRNKKIITPVQLTVVIFVLFTVVFCLISLVNHYLFRTYAADLGVFNHAVYSFSHFRADRLTLHLLGDDPAFFGDHFSPLVMLFVPFYWLLGSYGLLILQILAVLAGALGVFKCTQLFSGLRWLPVLACLQYFCVLSIYSALAFDFHTNVVAAGLFPWLIYFYYRGQIKWCLLIIVLIVMAKETMPLWIAFTLGGLMMLRKKSFRDYLRFEIPVLLMCLLYFWLVVNELMPFFREGKGTDQMARFTAVGGDIQGIIMNFFKNPLMFLEALYRNTSGNELFNGVKGEFYLLVLFSGGLAMLFRPAWLIMALPLFGFKMLSNDAGLWGINNHYSIEFVPILCLATADALSGISKKTWVYSLFGLQLVMTVAFTITKLENRKHQWYDSLNNRFYRAEHYQSNINVRAVYDILDRIPEKIPLSVSSELSPHLAFREKIYCFPVIKDAEMIVLFSDKKGDYPLGRTERKNIVLQLESRRAFRRVLDRDDILVLRRNNPFH